MSIPAAHIIAVSLQIAEAEPAFDFPLVSELYLARDDYFRALMRGEAWTDRGDVKLQILQALSRHFPETGHWPDWVARPGAPGCGQCPDVVSDTPDTPDAIRAFDKLRPSGTCDGGLLLPPPSPFLSRALPLLGDLIGVFCLFFVLFAGLIIGWAVQ